jgi:hypothetical protein
MQGGWLGMQLVNIEAFIKKTVLSLTIQIDSFIHEV